MRLLLSALISSSPSITSTRTLASFLLQGQVEEAFNALDGPACRGLRDKQRYVGLDACPHTLVTEAHNLTFLSA